MGQALRKCEDWAEILAMVSFAILAIFTVLDMLLRPLRIEFHMASEYIGFLMAGLIFLGLPAATRNRQHITVDFLIELAGSRARSMLWGIGDIIMLAYTLGLLFICGYLTYSNWETGLRSTGILRTILYIPQVGMMAGLFLMCATQIAIFVEQLRFGRQSRTEPPASIT